MEDYDSYLFIVLKALYHNAEDRELKVEQISLILGKNLVISFQENDKDTFDTVRERIKNGKWRIRRMGADYLAYSLLDVIVDNYFIVLESLGEEIEDLEEELVTDPDSTTLMAIHKLKRGMIVLRKSVWPLRELVSGMEREESPLIQESTYLYLRDVYDHVIHIIDTVETFRDMLSGILDIYLSSVSNRLNAVMKVLTIIATIFMPLTFLAGLYGMNFKYMPELEWRWGYPITLLLMALVSAWMLLVFRRKKWF